MTTSIIFCIYKSFRGTQREIFFLLGKQMKNSHSEMSLLLKHDKKLIDEEGKSVKSQEQVLGDAVWRNSKTRKLSEGKKISIALKIQLAF